MDEHIRICFRVFYVYMYIGYFRVEVQFLSSCFLHTHTFVVSTLNVPTPPLRPLVDLFIALPRLLSNNYSPCEQNLYQTGTSYHLTHLLPFQLIVDDSTCCCCSMIGQKWKQFYNLVLNIPSEWLSQSVISLVLPIVLIFHVFSLNSLVDIYGEYRKVLVVICSKA